MGEAKRRGTFEERKAAAIARDKAGQKKQAVLQSKIIKSVVKQVIREAIQRREMNVLMGMIFSHALFFPIQKVS